MTTQPINYKRHIITLNDDDLESFIRDWVDQKKSIYYRMVRHSGPGDLGRDVVGFHTKDQHEGQWDNYQCKQYSQTLSSAVALLEIGKILHYSALGNFTPPSMYYLVAPRGIKRELQNLIHKPSEFKKKLLDNWDKYCGKKIKKNTNISLNPSLIALINDFDFSNIVHVDIDYLLNDSHITPALYKWFGVDPGPAPKGETPIKIQKVELKYIEKLIDAYNDRVDKPFQNHIEVLKHSEYGKDMAMQRMRFYDADAFKRFYRDNTDQETLDTFESDIFHSVIDLCNGIHKDSLARMQAVMTQAANTSVSGILSNHARVSVKQGVCHHLANEEILKWRK